MIDSIETVPTTCLWTKAQLEIEAKRITNQFYMERQEWKTKYPDLSLEEIEESLKAFKKMSK